MGANVLVEFEKKNLTGGIFLKIGGIFLSWGQKLFWDQENQLLLGIILTPAISSKQHDLTLTRI